MKILVTGGAGFIGSHIVDALIEQGHRVVVIDDLCTGSLKNLNPAATFYKMSITSRKLADVFRKERPEIVNHQAAQVSVTRSVEDPIFDARVNVLGSLNLILTCLSSSVKRFIYASSGGAIYGEPKYLPANEDHPINPLSPYGISKHVVEHYLHLYMGQRGLKHTVLRYSNVYGPRQNPHAEAGVVAIFAGQMLRGETPTIFGKGDKTRDYAHVYDVIRANLLAIESEKDGIFNIGTGVETLDQEMFDTLAEVLGYKGKAKYEPVRGGEVYRICLDCSRAHRELHWQPQIKLREGLQQTVEYYRELARGPGK